MIQHFNISISHPDTAVAQTARYGCFIRSAVYAESCTLTLCLVRRIHLQEIIPQLIFLFTVFENPAVRSSVYRMFQTLGNDKIFTRSFVVSADADIKSCKKIGVFH